MTNTLGDFLVGELGSVWAKEKFVNLSPNERSETCDLQNKPYSITGLQLKGYFGFPEIIAEYEDPKAVRYYSLHLHLNDPVAIK